MVSHTGRSFMNQKKSMPRRYPMNRGGSPIGERRPPMLHTRKMKKMTVCTLCRRSLLVRSRG